MSMSSVKVGQVRSISATAAEDDDDVVVVVMIIMITIFCHFSADILRDLPACSLYLLMLIQNSTR